MRHHITKVQVSPKHYSHDYDNLPRWVSYWNQISIIKDLKIRNILEIGVGNKTLSTYLKNHDFNVTTLDIDKKLKPDFVGNVLNLPFLDNDFDGVVCCEVLEHIPFEKFADALKQLNRVTKKYVVLSLPQCRLSFSMMGKISLLRNFGFIITLPFPLKHKFDGQHYWEVGKKGFSYKLIQKIIKSNKFEIIKEYTPVLDNYHHFYVLRKK